MTDDTVMNTTIPSPLKERVAAYITYARTIMEERGDLKPMAFIGVDDGEGLAMFPWGNVPSTDVAAAAIREVARQGNAAWVIVMMEAYVMRTGDVSSKLKKHGSVRNMPDREEAVCVLVETREQAWTGMAIQEKRAGVRATFGEMLFNVSKQAEGRFIGLLPNTGETH